MRSLRGDESRGLPFAPRDLVDESPALWRPAAQAGHIDLRPGFIDEDQAPGIVEPLIGSPSFAAPTYVRTVLLAYDEGLLLTVTPTRRKKRLIIEVSALTLARPKAIAESLKREVRFLGSGGL